MIRVELDQKAMRELFLQRIDEHIKTIDHEVFFMNSKQLQKYLNMSWNSIVEHLISDKKFPSLKLGSKWLFPRQEVDLYMLKYYEEVQKSGGEIQKFKRKV
ncbi:hypothetical protein Desor_0678 [Desulfosporosinus orientis DSM 765]|uniref:Helix-turn-helix domain-containing protein n=1 Tax=Desulfosporosinus orientis (strain ATCC 19365 / DSM 765 / NCIMB 8382 / VKM B-1628 / Singapore I) TaxID=768706 RepID=G7W5E0_DESOD|nr:helix-turn-helix domain-containing protein [Desulfosporosinus orientis]AET66368.1 hypothetical protein Desor_0678 [Desulfosporosinus orientis DSM 765]